MARHKHPHPLGKVSQGKRLDISLPEKLDQRLQVISLLAGTTPTQWARDALEKMIEGEWVFMQRRINPSTHDDDGNNVR